MVTSGAWRRAARSWRSGAPASRRNCGLVTRVTLGVELLHSCFCSALEPRGIAHAMLPLSLAGPSGKSGKRSLALRHSRICKGAGTNSDFRCWHFCDMARCANEVRSQPGSGHGRGDWSDPL